MANLELADDNASEPAQVKREKIDIDALADEKLPGGRIKIGFSVEADFWVPGAIIISSLLLLWKSFSGN
jgi:hypothetical protein